MYSGGPIDIVEGGLGEEMLVSIDLVYDLSGFIIFYLFIKFIQPKVMTLNYFGICFYITNKSTLYNPSMYLQFFHILTPC